jgi:hypothetical protein
MPGVAVNASNPALVVFPKCGLANRLRVLASAAVVARAAGRQVFLNWTANEECNANWGDLFENEFPSITEDEEFFRNKGCLYTARDFKDPWRDMARAIISDQRPVVAVASFSHFWLEGTNPLKDRSEFYKTLRSTVAIRDKVNHFIEHNPIAKMIGIHIRRTDLNNSNQGMNPWAVSPLRDFIQQCRLQQKTRNAQGFFLATDSESDEHKLRRTFGSKIVTQPQRTLRRDATQGIQDALVDWLLLSQTMFIIRSYYSSFSEEAAIVNQTGNHVVIRRRPKWKIFLSDICYAPRYKTWQVAANIWTSVARKR